MDESYERESVCVCVCVCVCVFCVAHTSYFSLQCSHGHDHSCPLKSSPTEPHTDKQQAGVSSLCLDACVWLCVYAHVSMCMYNI